MLGGTTPGDQWAPTPGINMYKTHEVEQNSDSFIWRQPKTHVKPLEALRKGRWVGTLTWYYFTAHGDWLEGFPRRLGRAWWLTLWDDLTAGCDGLEGWVAVGTQSDPVTGFGPGRGAFTSREVGPLAICRPPRLCFNEACQKICENVLIYIPFQQMCDVQFKKDQDTTEDWCSMVCERTSRQSLIKLNILFHGHV